MFISIVTGLIVERWKLDLQPSVLSSRCLYQYTNIVSSFVMFRVKKGWVGMTYKEIIQQSQVSHSCSKCHRDGVGVR